MGLYTSIQLQVDILIYIMSCKSQIGTNRIHKGIQTQEYLLGNADKKTLVLATNKSNTSQLGPVSL